MTDIISARMSHSLCSIYRISDELGVVFSLNDAEMD